MYQIVGIDKITGELVDVTKADNATEKDIILRQEAKNYDGVWATHYRILSWSHRGGGRMARMEISG
jgi:hypothetical protein